MHILKFGPHFRIVVSTAEDGGIQIEYTHHGIDLLKDPEGHLMKEAFKVIARYGKLAEGGRVDRILLDTWTASGYGISVFERAGRTYLEISRGRKAYTLDATEVNGPLERCINALRRRFPDCTAD